MPKTTLFLRIYTRACLYLTVVKKIFFFGYHDIYFKHKRKLVNVFFFSMLWSQCYTYSDHDIQIKTTETA